MLEFPSLNALCDDEMVAWVQGSRVGQEMSYC